MIRTLATYVVCFKGGHWRKISVEVPAEAPVCSGNIEIREVRGWFDRFGLEKFGANPDFDYCFHIDTNEFNPMIGDQEIGLGDKVKFFRGRFEGQTGIIQSIDSRPDQEEISVSVAGEVVKFFNPNKYMSKVKE